MRYAVLLYQDERAWTEASPAEREALHAAHRAFDEAARGRARVLGGEALTGAANATTLRYDADGALHVTDGTFAETTDQLGGFYLVDAPDLDTMTDLCSRTRAGCSPTSGSGCCCCAHTRPWRPRARAR